MISYEEIFEKNRRWAKAKLSEDLDYFSKPAEEQHPEYPYFGCSDSRVPASEIIGVKPGEVFVDRNLANVVGNTDLNMAIMIDYAVVCLRVKHIIVCGHCELWGNASGHASRRPRHLKSMTKKHSGCLPPAQR
jgi:carbonic anhydrase